jgi:hypothetical protein
MAKKLHGKQIQDNTITQSQLSLVTPVNVNDATTKWYVDSILTGSTTGITSLSTAISSEISNRIFGDTSLTTAINIPYTEETISRTIYISTTGSDTTGDGSSGNTFASVLRAYQDVKTIINTGVTITIDVAAGTYNVDYSVIQKYYKNLVFLSNSGLIVNGKYQTIVSGLTIASSGSNTPYIYNVTGATFTTNEHAGRWLYASTTSMYPIVSNSATTINSTVGASSVNSIIENTVTFNIVNSDGTFSLMNGYTSNNTNTFEYNHINLSRPSGTLTIITDHFIDFKWLKITATGISINKICQRVNFYGAYMSCSSSGFNYGTSQCQLRRSAIIKTGTQSGVGITCPQNSQTIGLLTDGGVYLYNWSTGLQTREGIFTAATGNASFVFDTCITAIVISNNTNLYILNNCYIAGTVTNFISNFETLVGNYHINVNSLTGTATNLVSAGALVNGYVNPLTNSSIVISSVINNTLTIKSSSVIISGTTGFSGLTYNSDISANYTDRSLVDKGFVTGYTSGLTSADTSLSTAISTETSSRNSYDTSLSTIISSEISSRTSGDTSLSTSISSETSIRTSADLSLSTAIINITGGTNITNYGDNRLLSSDGTQKGINAESNLTFNGVVLGLTGNLSVTGNTYLYNISSSSQSNIIYYNTTNGQLTYGAVPNGTVTSISAGSGMTFSTITSSGTVTLGTPSELNTGTTNSVSSTSHTHFFNSASYITGSDGILVNGSGQYILDDNYLTTATLANLYSYTGITSNSDLGILVSGQTLGMVYIINTGTTTAEVNLGTTATGNEITPYKTISIASGQTVSVTVNMRLSDTINTTIYISSASWTNVDLTVQWANITYKNASTTISPGDLPIASSISLGAIKVGDYLSIAGDGALSVNMGLDGLTDVTLTSPTTTQILTYNGTQWINSGITLSTDLNSLTDVTLTSPTSSQILTYNGSQWINSGISITTNLDSLTDVTLSATTSGQTLIYNGTQWVNSGLTGGGGFLGNVTKNSSVPSLLDNNQWLRPEPQSGGTFNYTFDNFYDSSSLAINVDLSLEDVFLRYNKSGNYWIKESYEKPLSSGKTWIGSTNNVVQEISVIDEWVTGEILLEHIGQKYAYATQTLFKTDLDVVTTLQNFIFIQNINLKTVGNTAILTIPTSKTVLLNRAKLIILNNASPTTFTVSIGNNSSTYNNVVSATAIDDVLLYETYDLIIPSAGLPTMAVPNSTGSTLYFRVSVASTFTTDLYANLLVEGYFY